MQKIELTISPNYVPSWRIEDAMRELFQNALDQQSQNSANMASWSYDSNKSVFIISNATSKLTAASLLLGQTTKASDPTTVGQFGEGYKIATLVLLREGKTVTFYNNGAGEIWRPRFVKSRKFGTDILTFFIEKTAGLFTKPANADLSIVVEGITQKEYDEITLTNLHLRTDVKVLKSTQYGDIIDLPGAVFVNGLFVCNYSNYSYGYNFKPERIRLDRDRKMVSDFELKWLASKMWSTLIDDPVTVKLIAEGKADVAYIREVSMDSNVCDTVAQHFLVTYGHKAVPVVSQQDLGNVPSGYTGIIVSPQYCGLVLDSSLFSMPTLPEQSTLDRLQAWYNETKWALPLSSRETFEQIMEDLRNGIM